MSALRKVNYRNAPATTQVRPDQVANNTGGYVFQASDASRLERFLILGTDKGTYYVTEDDLTKKNVDWLIGMIKQDPELVLGLVTDISTAGRAFRNSAALFTLALVLNHGTDAAKNRAVEITPFISRTATHLYELAQYIENLGGWGRAKRRAVARWFTEKTPDGLAYQAVKYRQRNGWTLRDAMRLSHPVGLDKNVGNFILGHAPRMVGEVPSVIDGFIEMQASQDVGHVLAILDSYPKLPWETIPTQFLKDPKIWVKLFENGQLKGQALVRNVVRLSRIGAFDDLVFAKKYADALRDEEMIRKTKLHPMQYLMAQITYTEGQIDRKNGGMYVQRKKDWNTSPVIIDALQAGFYSSFKYAEPSNAKTLIGVDVSGSMSWNASIGSDLSAAQAAAAMAMVTARLEPFTQVMGFSNTVKDLGISPTMDFGTIMKKTQDQNFGSTNISSLIQYAGARRMEIDTFIVITDNEVNSGRHVHQALRDYRTSVNKNAKLVVMAVTSTEFTVADPTDRGMLDVVGFDSNAPKVVADFSRGDF